MSDQKQQELQSKLFADMSSAVGTKPTPVSFDTVSVDVSTAFSDSLASAYVVAIRSAIGETNCDVDVTPDQLKKYVTFLLRARVQHVNGEALPRETKFLRIPCVFALALAHVGRCQDSSLGITLTPVCTIPDSECMTLEEAKAFSEEVLSYAELGGLKCVLGLPKSIEGHLETMYFNWVEEKCCAHKTGLELGAAALSCFFKAKHLEALVMPRVVYGYRSDLEAALRSVIINS